METKILNKIEELRQCMNCRADELGVSHPIVLGISQKIDSLHNEYIIYQKNGEDKWL